LRKPAGQSLEAESQVVRVQLIKEPSIIAECRSILASAGAAFVCDRCTNADASVMAILILNEDPEECYAICAECLRELPEGIDA
jgi:hypothetical protein